MTTLRFDRALLDAPAPDESSLGPAAAVSQMASAEPAALTDEEVDLRADWAGARSVVWIILGVGLVSFILAVVMYGWELAGLCTIGLTLYSLIFGAPFWLAVVDAAAQNERARLTGESVH